jgi:hypothetical protein
VEGLLPANAAALFPGSRLVYTDTLGEWTLRFLLGRALSEDEASRAAAGWRGDRIAFVVSGGRMGYFWRIRFDDALSAARFEAALRKARASRPASVPKTEKPSLATTRTTPGRLRPWLQRAAPPARSGSGPSARR